MGSLAPMSAVPPMQNQLATLLVDNLLMQQAACAGHVGCQGFLDNTIGHQIASSSQLPTATGTADRKALRSIHSKLKRAMLRKHS